MAKLLYVVNNIINVVNNVIYRQKDDMGTCLSYKYQEFSCDFVVNVIDIMQNVVKLHRNDRYMCRILTTIPIPRT